MSSPLDFLIAEVVVDCQVLAYIADEVDEGPRIGDHPYAQALLRDGLDHMALVLRAIKIAAGQQLALPHKPEGFLTSNGDLALGVVEAVRGEGCLVGNCHAVQIFGEVDETLEIDQRHMVDANAGQVLQRTNGQLCASERKGRIYLVLAVATDID